MAAWRRVTAVAEAFGGLYRLTLDCGHQRTLDPIRRDEDTREQLLASTVPCEQCPGPESRRAG